MDYTRAFVGGGGSAQLYALAFIRPPSQRQLSKGHGGAPSRGLYAICASKALGACKGGLGAVPGLSSFRPYENTASMTQLRAKAAIPKTQA